MTDCSVLRYGSVLWHRARPGLVSSLFPKGWFSPEAPDTWARVLRPPGAARAGANPRVDPAEPGAISFRLVLSVSGRAPLKADPERRRSAPVVDVGREPKKHSERK